MNIDWRKYPEESKLIPDFLKEKFEWYFEPGRYMTTGYGATLHLNDFLKSLSAQERDIFLSLKSNNQIPYTKDKIFVEMLLYYLERANPDPQRPMLFAILYIIQKHEASREVVYKNYQIIEKIANCDNRDISHPARLVLDELSAVFKIPLSGQYVFRKNSRFEFYLQFGRIIARARTYIWYWDNYANEEILKQIYGQQVVDRIKEIRILCKDDPQTKKHRTNLEMAIGKFRKDNPELNLEARTSSITHDRFLIIDDEQWHLGQSIKDVGNSLSVVTQLKGEAASEIVKEFQEEWAKANDLWGNPIKP